MVFGRGGAVLGVSLVRQMIVVMAGRCEEGVVPQQVPGGGAANSQVVEHYYE